MKLSRKYRILFLIAGGIFLVWLVYYAAISVIYGLKLRSLRAQVAAQGSSLDQAELARQYAGLVRRSKGGGQRIVLSHDQNAAYLYKAAGDLMDVTFQMGKSDDPAIKAYTDFLMAKPDERASLLSDKRAELETFLNSNAMCLELLHKAANYDRASFDLDYSKGDNIQLPHLWPLREGSRMLMLEAWMAASTGDAGGLLQATWAALRVSRATDDEPLLISSLVGIATDHLVLETMQEALPLIQPTESDLRKILTEIEARNPKDFAYAAEGERAGNSMRFKRARNEGLSQVLHDTGNLPPDRPHIKLDAAVASVLNGLLPDEAYSLAWMNRFVEAASRVDSLSLDELRHWDVEEDAALRHAVSSPGSRYFHMLSGICLPALSRALIEAKKDIARHDVAACGVAAELYRLDNGAYPASLESLAPKYLPSLRNDTFSGKPLLFKSLLNGVLIYSIGLNGTDDAGVDAPTEPRPDDIAWRVERPLPVQP